MSATKNEREVERGQSIRWVSSYEFLIAFENIRTYRKKDSILEKQNDSRGLFLHFELQI
jgi:hypothetical protein